MEDEWQQYGRALIGSMTEILQGAGEDAHLLLLETADYWLSLGLAIGLDHSEKAARLLELIEAHEGKRAELGEDGRAFIAEVLR